MDKEETTLATSVRRRGSGPPDDDWLVDAADVEWFPEERAPGAQRPRRVPVADQVPDEVDEQERLYQRRRAVAVIALFAVVAVVVVVLLVFSGGSGGTKAPTTPVATTPAATTPVTTTPVTTTKTSTTTSTNASPSTGTLKVVLPAAGKIKLGDKGDTVTTLQNALVKAGNGPLKVDGVFGPLTEQAVKDFQLAHQLVSDGVVGAKTAPALNAAVAAAQ
jgi:hypothetical protein